jgi:RNA polymerase sigma factor (sigma-70 family)
MAENVDEAHDRNNVFWMNAYQDYFNRLCSRARRLLTNGNPTEAEDVVSEAFLRAMSYVEHPELIVNLFAYLWITAKHVLIAKRRKENSVNMKALDELLSTSQHPTVEPQALRILENKEFEDAISAGQGPLTSRERRLLKLHLQGYNCDEIATKLDEDVRLTRSDLNAVRAKVRYRLMRAKAKTKGSGQS